MFENIFRELSFKQLPYSYLWEDQCEKKIQKKTIMAGFRGSLNKMKKQHQQTARLRKIFKTK